MLFKKVNDQLNHWIRQRLLHTKEKSKLTNLESVHLIEMQAGTDFYVNSNTQRIS